MVQGRIKPWFKGCMKKYYIQKEARKKCVEIKNKHKKIFFFFESSQNVDKDINKTQKFWGKANNFN